MIYYLGFGSNIGDKKKNINNALHRIAQFKGCIITKISSFYKTKPWGYKKQEDFLNLVAEINAIYPPEEFLYFLQHVEKEMGRIEICKWGPRIIDIDILFCDNMILETEDLKIPHPLLHQRDFVLKPMVELAADYVHPYLKLSMRELYDKLLKEI